MNILWTIGHSNKSIEEFLELLQSHQIEFLADVRRYPGSAKYLHFNKDSLVTHLKDKTIQYAHFEELGGRRKPVSNSKNNAWRNDSFRGYADYMETENFEYGYEKLVSIGLQFRTAIMCSEAVWWRCHRSLISDRLKSDHYWVLHIFTKEKLQEHPYTGAASLIEGKLSYR